MRGRRRRGGREKEGLLWPLRPLQSSPWGRNRGIRRGLLGGRSGSAALPRYIRVTRTLSTYLATEEAVLATVGKGPFHPAILTNPFIHPSTPIQQEIKTLQVTNRSSKGLTFTLFVFE
jgi:hypothetical protein